MDAVAERVRDQLFKAGQIPEDQLTEDELQQVQAAASQPQQPDAMMVAAQAEMAKAQADMLGEQNKQQENQLKAMELQLKAEKQQAEIAEKAATIANKDMATAKLYSDILNTDADTLNKIREAMGVDAIMSAGATEAYQDQAQIITQTQDNRLS